MPPLQARLHARNSLTRAMRSQAPLLFEGSSSFASISAANAWASGQALAPECRFGGQTWSAAAWRGKICKPSNARVLARSLCPPCAHPCPCAPLPCTSVACMKPVRALVEAGLSRPTPMLRAGAALLAMATAPWWEPCAAARWHHCHHIAACARCGVPCATRRAGAHRQGRQLRGALRARVEGGLVLDGLDVGLHHLVRVRQLLPPWRRWPHVLTALAPPWLLGGCSRQCQCTGQWAGCCCVCCVHACVVGVRVRVRANPSPRATPPPSC